MNDQLLADIQQLFVASENRMYSKFERKFVQINQRLDELTTEMRAGFAGVAEAIELIHIEFGVHQKQLNNHDKRIHILESHTQKS